MRLVDRWKTHGYQTAAASICKVPSASGSVIPYLFVFPVTVRRISSFSWTDAWLKKAISEEVVERNNVLRTGSLTDRKFSSAFANLTREASGLETLELDSLHAWLESQLAKVGQGIDLGGIRIPRDPLRYFGILVIVLIQGYSVLHLIVTERRLRESSAIDLGAFQPWVMLYGGALCRWTSIGILSVPPGADGCGSSAPSRRRSVTFGHCVNWGGLWSLDHVGDSLCFPNTETSIRSAVSPRKSKSATDNMKGQFAHRPSDS